MTEPNAPSAATLLIPPAAARPAEPARRAFAGGRAALVLALLAPAAATQTVWLVKASAPFEGDGLSWATAMVSLQSALDVVAIGDQIWVAAGTYRPTGLSDPAEPRSARFWLHDPFELYGGFVGTETALAQRDPALFDDTILSGDIGVLGDPSDNAFRVVEVSSGFPFSPPGISAVLDGFRITGGRSTGQGGGVLVKGPGQGGTNPRVILRRCILDDNHAAQGGGLATVDLANARLDRCLVERNYATNQGGGVYSMTGFLRAFNTRFVENKSASLGGALFADGQTALGLVRYANCVFSRNDARLGGVAYLKGGPSVAGAASWHNCTFVENVATQAGGVLYAVTTTPRQAKAEVHNSILWNNLAPASPSIFGTGLDVRFSDVQGGYPGSGNIDSDPLFVTSDRPGAGSPASDAGSNALLPSDLLDLDGDGLTSEELPLDLLESARRLDDPMAVDTGAGSAPIVDMGAYEVVAGRGP